MRAASCPERSCGHRSSSAATRAPRRTVASSKGAARAAARQQLPDLLQARVVELGDPVGERRQPAERLDRAGPPLPLGVRRPRHQAVRVVHPEPALLPGACGQRHQPAQAVRAVLAALVEGVGGDPHRVDETDAREQGRAAADQVRVGADHLADDRQPRPVGLDGGEVLETAAGDRPGVEEVELEVVDAEVHQPGERVGEHVQHAGVGEVQADQVVAPVAAGVADHPLG